MEADLRPGDYLKEVPLFSALNEEERDLLSARVDRVQLAKNSTLFSVGDPGDSMYVVKSGAAEIFVKTKTGEKMVLERPTNGDFFGELSLLDPGPRTATCVILEDMEALCVDQGDLDELFRLRPESALGLLAATGKRLRHNAALLRNAATRNVNEEMEDRRTTTMRVADWIADFSGSMPFLYIHIGIFAIWIGLNVHVLPFGDFDPFPFGLLTMVVSLEAIILSVFVLLSQNRQVERERVRGDIEYDCNLKSEMQIQHLHEKLDHLIEESLGRLERMERFERTMAHSKP